jgi:PAS domain-containing protein
VDESLLQVMAHVGTQLGRVVEREQAREALRRSEERFQLVARATSDVIWDWNILRGELTWNDAIQRAFRYSPQQVEGTMEWWANHVHPEDRERAMTGMHAVVNGSGDFWTDEYLFQRGDGSYAVVLDQATWCAMKRRRPCG